MKFNLPKTEVEAILKYMQDNNLNCVTVERKEGGIGGLTLVSKDWDSEQEDITDYGSW